MIRTGEGRTLIRVLGQVEARASLERFWVQPPPQQRLVLALLVADLGSVCRADRLVEALWGEPQAPNTGRRRVQGLVSRLRAVLQTSGESPTRLCTVSDGWQLDLDRPAVDLRRFEGLIHAGTELADHPALLPHTTRLEEHHLVLREREIDELGAEPGPERRRRRALSSTSTGCSTPWPGGWRRRRRRRRCCWCLRICTRPPGRPCCWCATWCSPAGTTGCWWWPPTATPPTTDQPSWSRCSAI